MKKLILIHGITTKEECDKIEPLNEINWNKWIKKIALDKGYEVSNPLIPNLWDGDYEAWKKVYDKEEFNEDTTIIAHSAGATFIVRYLGDRDIKIKKLILVTPAKIVNEANMYLKNFYDFDVKDKVKDSADEIIIMAGEHDEQRHIDSGKLYSDSLGVDLIMLKNRGHCTDPTLEELLEYLD